MPQMSPLMFDIVARDRSRAAFEAAERGADGLAKKAVASGQSASRGIDLARSSAGNLAAQFNDIGVQLAGGQSPFLIALQQGSQIGQVLGPMGRERPFRRLAAHFWDSCRPSTCWRLAPWPLPARCTRFSPSRRRKASQQKRFSRTLTHC
ncbi:phage tail length tape measure family protein [Rhizobium alarense]|uniref:phage tail length tape measure family protein n=1 Tax=Rhizobium alarense TaxID=2846851 RepID=UPI002E2FED18|nr:phage tail length tape measure family protein [Rhizobium alarense]